MYNRSSDVWRQALVGRCTGSGRIHYYSVIFVDENENDEKQKNNEFVNKN